MTKHQLIRRFLKPLAFLLCLLPLGLLTFNFLTDNLSANPLDDITDATGTWTLRFLVITLAITPLRRLSGWHDVIKFRRMIGLFAFFYGLLHFTTYIYLDKFFEWEEIIADIGKRPFITVGFTALALMVPLALTSFNGAIRLLGKKWQLLHRLVYFSGIAGVIHYLWLVKADKSRPLTYGVIIGGLLLFRVADAFVKRKKQRVKSNKSKVKNEVESLE